MRVNITGNNTLAFCLFNLESLSSHSDLVWMQGCLTLNDMAMRILAIQLVIKARYSEWNCDLKARLTDIAP